MQRIDNLDETFHELAVINAAVAFAATHNDKETGADLLLRIREIAKAVKKLEDSAKDIFEDVKLDGKYKVEGLICALAVNRKVDWRLQTKDVKIEMGEAWYDKRCKQILSYRLLTTAV